MHELHFLDFWSYMASMASLMPCRKFASSMSQRSPPWHGRSPAIWEDKTCPEDIAMESTSQSSLELEYLENAFQTLLEYFGSDGFNMIDCDSIVGFSKSIDYNEGTVFTKFGQ